MSSPCALRLPSGRTVWIPVFLLAFLEVAVAFGSAQHATEAPMPNSSRSIPVHIVRSEVLVPIRVNGEQLTFILDSGAQSFVLDQKVAIRMKLQSWERRHGFGAGDRPVLIPQVRGINIKFADLRISNGIAGIIDLSPISAYLHTPIDGVAGTRIFSGSVIATDYCRRQIQVSSPEVFRLPSEAIVIPITEVGGNYATPATVHFDANTEVSGMFLLDTGAGPLIAGLTREKGERLPIYRTSGKQEVIPALGGNFQARVVPAQSINVGGASLSDIDVHIAENISGGLAAGPYAGVIGGRFFRNFLTIFDVPHRRVVLAPAQKCAAGL